MSGNITMKYRDPYYCNLKLLLIFLVIYGHTIEYWVNESDTFMLLYKIIYIFHMPLFTFLSGYFIKSINKCTKQIIKSIIIYIVMQIFYYLVFNYPFSQLNLPIRGAYDTLSISTPYYHLWYLLSLFFWSIIALIIHLIKSYAPILTKPYITVSLVIISVIISCSIGYHNLFNEKYSLSRTIVFLPFFLAGLFLPANIKWNRYRLYGIIALAAGIILFIRYEQYLRYTFLRQKLPYASDSPLFFKYRMVSLLLGFLFGFFILTVIPNKNYSISILGADTMIIFLFHIFFILFYRKAALIMHLSLNIIFITIPVACVFIIVVLYYLTKLLSYRFTKICLIK